jgi:xanthine dehydrogenase accessory factor
MLGRPSGWLDLLGEAMEAGEAAVLVTIADARGSAPRDAGVKMTVTAEAMAGTIGGGNLEHEAIRAARQMLDDGRMNSELRAFALGPSLGQCCGGSTRLLFEPILDQTQTAPWLDPLSAARASGVAAILATDTAISGAKLVITETRIAGSLDDTPNVAAIVKAARADLAAGRGQATLRKLKDRRQILFEPLPPPALDIVLLGAGHVGKALIRVLGDLPCRVAWADDRPEQFPDQLPANVRARFTKALDQVIAAARPGSVFLVMTYSHDLDFALCARVLERGDSRYLGLIGSKTKRARFAQTMRALGLEEALIESVVCPIGITAIKGKTPAEIAVATAAQLLALPAAKPAASGAGA